MIYLLNFLIVAELLSLCAILAFSWRDLIAHWKTSAAGLIVLFVVGFVNVTWLVRFHTIHDTIELVYGLAIALAFFVAADAKK
jgi:undecaprenyl pyrophosphate phosphatase UppP